MLLDLITYFKQNYIDRGNSINKVARKKNSILTEYLLNSESSLFSLGLSPFHWPTFT